DDCASIQEEAGDGLVTPSRGLMQRHAPFRVDGADRRTFRQKQANHLFLSELGGVMEGNLHPLVGELYVAPSVEQQSDNLNLIVEYGLVARRQSLPGLAIEGGPAIEQEADQLDVPFPRGDVKGGDAVSHARMNGGTTVE